MIRVVGQSEGWSAIDGRKTTYQAGEIKIEKGGQPGECVRCGQEREEAHKHNAWSDVRRLNVTYWLGTSTRLMGICRIA